MVKKTEHMDFDFSEWDDFQDDGLGGFTSTNKKGGKRKAITEFGGSFLSGLKKQLLKPEVQRKFLNAALPDSGYVRAFDSAHVAADNIKQLSYGVRDDLKKASKDFKEPLKSLERSYRGNKFVPKTLANTIKGWESNSPSGNSRTNEANEFSDELGGIFTNTTAASAVMTKKAIKEASDKATVTSYMQTKLSIQLNKSAENIQMGVGRLVAFNDQVLGRAMRKSLELQFKHYAVAREQLDVLQQTRDMHKESYRSLILNTGLPEAVKITNMELAGQQMKRQLFGAVNKRVANNFKDIGAKLSERIGSNAREFIETTSMGLSGGLDGLAARREHERNMRDMGMGDSRATKAGDFGGSLAAWILSSAGGKALGNKLSGNKKVSKYSDTLLNASDNLPHWFNRIVNERTDSPMANMLMDMLGLDDFTHKTNPKVRGSAVPELDKQAYWNVQSQLALTEVIPGHLSTANRFLEMIATGNQNVEQRHFDYETAKFTTEFELSSKYQKKMFGTDKAKQVRKSVDAVIKQMDSEGVLSPKAKNELRRHLLKTAQNDQANIDVRALISTDSPLSPDVSEEVARVLGQANNFNESVATDYDRWNHKDMIKRSMSASGEFQSRTRNVNQLMEQLRDVLPTNMQQAIDGSKQGHTALLERLGIIDWKNGAYNLNRDKEIDFYLGKGRPGTGPNSNGRNSNAPPGGGPSGGGGTGGPGLGGAGGGSSTTTTTTTTNPYTPYGGRGPGTSPLNPNPRGGVGSKASDNVWPSTDSSVNIDSAALQSLQDGIIAAIDRNSPLESLRISNELLDAIRTRLEEGVNTASGDVGDNTTNRRRRGRFFSKLMTPLRMGFSGMKNYTKFMYGKVIPGVVKAPFKMAGSAWNGLKNVAGAKGIFDIHSKKFTDKLGDVFVQGRKSPVLREDDLVAGKYIDQATGKVIRKFKDITGAVVDATGKIVLTEDEFKAGLFTIRNGLPTRIVTGAFGLAMKGLKGAFGLATKPYVWMGKGLVGGVKLGAKLLFGGKAKLQDIYVAGERTPRLIASVISAGGYFNEDGSVIKTMDDIKGNIVDATGNVVLTVADMAKGITDKYGKPIEEFTKKSFSLMRMAGSVIKFGAKSAWAFTKGAGKLYGKALRGMGRGAKAVGKGVLGLFGFGKGKSNAKSGGGGFDEITLQMLAHQADRVDQIYDLLKERLPTQKKRKFDDSDGDGLRDGSRESWFARMTQPKTEEAEKEKKEKKERGLFGLMMAAVTGIGGLLGTLRGWGSKIFHLMRITSMMKAGGSLLGGLGGMFGGRRGRGARAGRMGAAASAAGNFAKNNAGKLVGLAALTGVAGYAFAGGNSRDLAGSFDVLSKSEQAALKAVDGADGSGGGSGSGSGSGSGGEGGENGGQPGFWGNLGNAVIGSVGGEAAAIMAMMGISGIGGAIANRRGRGRPEIQGPPRPPTPGGAPAAPKGALGKTLGFLSKNKYGRLLTAGVTGAGLYTGMNAMQGGDKEVDPQTAALKSMGITMGLDAGMAFGLPYLMSKMGRGGAGAAEAAAGASAGATGGAAGAAGTGGAAAGAAGAAGGAARGSRLGGMARGAGKLLGKIALPAALGMGAYDAYKKEGNMWEKGGAFLETAAPALAGAGVMKLAANPLARAVAMQGARSLAMGAGALIAGTIGWPVLLAGAAIAGAGYLAYKGYKRWFKKDKEALVRFRMAQYGFKLDDKKRSDMILRLEKMAMDCVTIKNDKAEFNKNLQADQIVGLFGILPDDQASVQKFGQWFAYRFRPIFLKAYFVSNKISKKKDLHSADSVMAREEKIQYLQETNSITEKPSPYEVMLSPFSDQKEVPLTGKDITDVYTTAMRDVKKEKSRTEVDRIAAKKELDDEVGRKDRARNDNRLQMEGDNRAAYKKELADRAAKTGSTIDRVKSWGFDLFDKAASSAVGHGVSNFINMNKVAGQTVYEMFTGTPTMSKSQKQWQLMVYKGFKTAGFSENQARILTAEVGRENSYKPENLFGGHADPHAGSNLGMISWQGPRRTKLVQFLAEAKVLINGDRIQPGQPALDAQARFVMWELRNTEKKAGTPFLANPNIDYKTGADLIGRYYIRWRIDDPKYRAAGIKNRDGFYNMLNQQLGGAPKDNSTTAANPNAKAGAPPPYLMRGNQPAGSTASGANPLFNKDGKINTPNVMGGPVGSAMSAMGVFSAPSGGAGGKDALVAFLATLKPDQIKAGAGCVVRSDSGVDLVGMNKKFLAIFFAMAYEYNQRTGKKIQVNSAYRSVAKQKVLYDAWIARGKTGAAAAKPGNSRHNSGVAIDINSTNANECERLGLLKKYNFHRPVRGEAWHLENHYFSAAKETQDALKQSAAGGTPTPAQQNQAAEGLAGTGVPDVPPPRPKFSVSQNMSTGAITNHETGKVETAPAPAVPGSKVNVPGVTSSSSTAQQTPSANSAPVNAPAETRQRGSVTATPATQRATVAAEATGQRQTETANADIKEQTSLMRKQLDVQSQMLNTLKDIKSALGKTAPQSTASSTQQDFHKVDTTPPVSMSIKQ